MGSTSEYNRRWREKHPERAKASQRAWVAKNPNYSSEWKKNNPEKHRRYCKKFRDSHPGYQRNRRLISSYGITSQQYDEMVKAQNGLCALCSRHRRLDIDHDHKTGKTRALLCVRCNRALGWFWDDPEKLERAAAYIRKYSDA